MFVSERVEHAWFRAGRAQKEMIPDTLNVKRKHNQTALCPIRNTLWTSSSVRAGRTSGWSFTDRWTSCLSTTWWPVRSGPPTPSSTTGRNLWPTTWPCPTSCWGSWRTERCSTPWGSLTQFSHISITSLSDVPEVFSSQFIVCPLQPFSDYCGS